MVYTTIILSILFAFIFALILGYGFSRRGPGPTGGIFFIFLLIFMFTWAIGLWIEPIGPVRWGVPWLGYLLIAFFIALLIGALLPPSRPGPPVITKAEINEEIRQDEKVTSAVQITFGVFFWLLVIALFVIAMVRIF
ncbi:MAG: hypothetical protein R6W71_12305 [Bacteroidales bacterium]